jgi:DNA-directed RNA polymerase specialized sigma24 family protein
MISRLLHLLQLLKTNNNNAELVQVVYREHHKWLMQVAFNFTQDKEAAEDLTQELYLYLLDMQDINKIRYNGTVNLFYLYKTLKSKFLNGIKQSKKIQVMSIEEDFLEVVDEDYDYDRDSDFEIMLEATKDLLEDHVHWFDSKLLQTYINEDHSIASLHKATGISKSSIWTSLNKTKSYIKYSYASKERSGSI